MGFEIKKIDPLDLQPRKAVGVALPFSGEAVFNSTYETKEAIKTNLINFFLTGIGERYMNPLFGTRLNRMLFEQLTPSKKVEIEKQVIYALEVYFPRVVVSEFRLQENLNDNLINFYLKYSIRDTGIEDDL